MSRKKSFWNNGEKILFSESPRGRLYLTYSLIAKNRFRWINLPTELESHIIEDYLYNCGQVAFFFDKEKGGYLTLPCYQSGKLNVYGEPLQFGVTGIDYSKQLFIDDMVWIKCNDDAYPTRNQVLYYTEWIELIEKTMKRNLKLLRQPDIIATSKDNELSMKNLYKQIDDEEKDAIFYDKDKVYRGEVGISVLNRNAQNYLPHLQKNKDDVTYELLTFLGINNANTSKRERLVVDEVNVNNIHILMNLDVEYKNRKLACEKINKKFGLNIDVELVIEELEDSFMNNNKTKGDE